MLYRKPDYFEQFQCIADKCEDTCCAGWQIAVDKAALEKYKKIHTTYLYKIMGCVDWETKTFRQDNDKRCAFLNSDNLCDMYQHLGEDSLCKTCREYPRHTEEFEGVREITLSISCPEVARILMERKTPVKFFSYENSDERETEDYEDFDPFLHSILENAREEMLKILQNRELTLQERTMLILGMAHDMQGRINRQEMFACEDVVRKYKGKQALKYVKKHLEQGSEKEASRAFELFEKLYELELLREEWDALLHETQTALFYHRKEYCSSKSNMRWDKYNTLTIQNLTNAPLIAVTEIFAQHRQEFELWKKEHPEIDIRLEQLLVYFLFTYFVGAVYDGEVFAKAQMAVYCTWMIELLWMARWLLNGKELGMEEMTELVYRFSREVEHSDDNLEHIEKIMRKKWLI